MQTRLIFATAFVGALVAVVVLALLFPDAESWRYLVGMLALHFVSRIERAVIDAIGVP